MNKLFAFLAVVLLTFTLTACAATTGSSDMKVKCPACGHDFSVKAGGP